jgi:hypothetical protein
MVSQKVDTGNARRFGKSPHPQKDTKAEKPLSESPYLCEFASPNLVVDRQAFEQSWRIDGLDDQIWFDKHPGSTVRMRLATRLERVAYKFKGRVQVWVMFFAAGSHRRMFFTKDSFTD